MSFEFTIITICTKWERQEHTKKRWKEVNNGSPYLWWRLLLDLFCKWDAHSVTYADRLMQQGQARPMVQKAH